jgi:hypothetical protein
LKYTGAYFAKTRSNEVFDVPVCRCGFLSEMMRFELP